MVHAEVVLGLLDALGIDRAVVGGCAWGGAIAVHAAVAAPERVLGVLEMNPPLEPRVGGHALGVIGAHLRAGRLCARAAHDASWPASPSFA